MKTRRLLGLLTIAALVPIGAGAASAQGGTGGGGTTTTSTDADLQITGSASTNAPDPGSVYTYTFQIKNSGPATATSVLFTDPVPAGTVPNYATLGGSTLPCALFGDGAGGTNVQCTVGSILKGGQVNIVVSMTAPQVAQAITNTATVTASSPDPKPSNNAVTVSVTVKAPTGGVCKGGICDTVPAPVAAPCAILTNASAPVGYYSIWAAIWNTFTVQSCSTASEAISIQVTETDVSTGTVAYDITWPFSMTPGQNLGMVLDNDFAAYSTTYFITFTVRDSSGNVLNAASVTATTPGPR